MRAISAKSSSVAPYLGLSYQPLFFSPSEDRKQKECLPSYG